MYLRLLQHLVGCAELSQERARGHTWWQIEGTAGVPGSLENHESWSEGKSASTWVPEHLMTG